MIALREPPDKELYLRIETIQLLRIIFLTCFAVTILILQQRYSYKTPVTPLSITLGIAFFLSGVYAFLLKHHWNLLIVSSIQIAGDLLVVAGFLFSTGGIDSPLSFLNPLVIIATSIMLPRTATYLVASLASIAYGLTIDLEYYGVIHPIHFFSTSPVTQEGGYVFYKIFVNIVSYYSVAYLSSLLSHRLRLIKEELKLTSSHLEKLQAFNKNVVQNMGNGLLTTDLNGRITTMNPAAEKITGFKAEEGMDQLCFQLLDISTLKTIFQESQFPTLPGHIEGTCKKKNGQPIFVRIKISRLYNPENMAETQGFILVFEDLSEIRDMEEKITQAEKLAVVGRFSAGLAHEIRNPLASLSGSIQMIKQGLALDGPFRNLMDIVLKETDRLNRTVTDFLHYANPRKKRRVIVDLTEAIQETITLMENSGEFHASLSIKFKSPDDHLLIQFDEQQIQQLIWNLCINGIQAMPQGGTLNIEIRPVDGFKHKSFYSENKGVLLTVEDNGYGISPENMQNIFDPFFTTKEDGVGLGLARCQQIVENYGDYIGVDSQDGQGATFSIFFRETQPFPEEHEIAGKVLKQDTLQD